MNCPWRDKIGNAYYAEKWLDSHPIAAVVRWNDGREFLWIDGRICEIVQGAMPPKEILYNLENLSPSERKEAIEGIKSMADIVHDMRHGKPANDWRE